MSVLLLAISGSCFKALGHAILFHFSTLINIVELYFPRMSVVYIIHFTSAHTCILNACYFCC